MTTKNIAVFRDASVSLPYEKVETLRRDCAQFLKDLYRIVSGDVGSDLDEKVKSTIREIKAKRVFVLTKPHGPYGARIFVAANAPMREGEKQFLDRQSVWGGNTSSSPREYLMWEFELDPELRKYEAAARYLRNSGFTEVADLPKPESDEAYRERLIKVIPEGAVYAAEDIGNGSGKLLDAIGEQYDCPRN